MNIDNESFLDDFAMERNITEASLKTYQSAVKQYSNFTQKTMGELIVEAEKEEDEGVRWKNRTLKHRLLSFRTYLYKNYLKTTAQIYFRLIQTLYRHYEIEIQKLPPVSQKNTNENTPVVYSDLPDEKLIEKILLSTNTLGRALIFFMLSSGCARTETANITIGDYLEATKEYHNCDNIYDALEKMANMENIIPTFHILRQKTKKYYYTFCSAEASNSINLYLMNYNGELKNEDRLFHSKPKYISDFFIKINNTFNLGKRGTYNRFRPHMLRKFHASRLRNDGMSMDIVDSLQGRSKNNVHRAYFLDSIENLKQEYINHMSCLLIEWNGKNLTFKSQEYMELEKENIVLQKENKEKTRQLETMSSRLTNIEKFVFQGLTKKDIAEMELWID